MFSLFPQVRYSALCQQPKEQLYGQFILFFFLSGINHWQLGNKEKVRDSSQYFPNSYNANIGEIIQTSTEHCS